MSWQVYVDSNLLGTGKVQKAAILGQKGGVWAKSHGYELSLDEQKAILSAFDNPETTQASGIRLGGQKFITLQCNKDHIYGKKGASTSRSATAVFVADASFSTFQADGCVLVKTKQAILVTEYAPPTQAPESTSIVEGLGDYLKGVNY
ncbi:Profilin [Tylopilus felleus]